MNWTDQLTDPIINRDAWTHVKSNEGSSVDPRNDSTNISEKSHISRFCQFLDTYLSFKLAITDFGNCAQMYLVPSNPLSQGCIVQAYLDHHGAVKHPSSDEKKHEHDMQKIEGSVGRMLLVKQAAGRHFVRIRGTDTKITKYGMSVTK